MICGHCNRRDVDIAHVKTCSTWHNELPRNAEPVDEATVAPEGVYSEAIGRFVTPQDDHLAEQQVGISTKVGLEHGMFVRYHEGVGHDVEYYAIVESKAGHLYAKRFDTETKRWEFANGAITMLRRQEKAVWQEMSKEDAAEFGHAFGVCMVCGRELTNPDSIEAGIGPICAGKW